MNVVGIEGANSDCTTLTTPLDLVAFKVALQNVGSYLVGWMFAGGHNYFAFITTIEKLCVGDFGCFGFSMMNPISGHLSTML